MKIFETKISIDLIDLNKDKNASVEICSSLMAEAIVFYSILFCMCVCVLTIFTLIIIVDVFFVFISETLNIRFHFDCHFSLLNASRDSNLHQLSLNINQNKAS